MPLFGPDLDLQLVWQETDDDYSIAVNLLMVLENRQLAAEYKLDSCRHAQWLDQAAQLVKSACDSAGHIGCGGWCT